MKPRRYILTVSCPDRVGIVAAVTSLVASLKGSIAEAAQHGDDIANWFFMRHELLADLLEVDLPTFRERFGQLAADFNMTWQIADSAAPKRVVILVSKQDHCLADLLYRWRTGELGFDLRAVISNHEDLRSYVEWHGVPYHCVPVPKDGKAAAFARTQELIDGYNPELIVLARYMQILPPDVCERYAGRVINIHHSFLPSFAGGKPYHQAYERGVKLIGATCHYVTAELDAGPIIEQDVIRVDHSETIDDMARLGRDVEKTVLARGVRFCIEDRVLIHENKTVVFP